MPSWGGGKSGGFLCGRGELFNWNTCEIGQIRHQTDDILGRLADLVPSYTEEDVRQHVKLSVGNLYHALCHRAVHAADGWDADGLRTPMPVLYILQNRVYLETGVYWKTRRELLAHLDGIDAEVLQTAAALKAGGYHGRRGGVPPALHLVPDDPAKHIDCWPPDQSEVQGEMAADASFLLFLYNTTRGRHHIQGKDTGRICRFSLFIKTGGSRISLVFPYSGLRSGIVPW